MKASTPSPGKRKRRPRTTYFPVFVKIAKNLRAMKMTNEEIAKVFGVTSRTIWIWRRRHKDFDKSMKASWVGRRPKGFRYSKELRQ